MNLLNTIGFVVQDGIWSAVAAVCFGVLFNVPSSLLAGCAIAAGLGHALRTLLMQLGLDIEVSTLVGSTLVGFISLYLSRRWHAPIAIFTLCAAITMVPGSFAYRTMLAIIELASGNADTANMALIAAATNAVRTALILGAIALGIAAPALLFEREPPVV
ncbi:MAG: threonine/serine exporter [Anaerolineaceae bacterium]|nr:threonine/serine exporter [Anaerolineaceae bacterium]